MSVEKLVGIGAIFALACAGWWTLGNATASRSEEYHGKLGAQVERLWGVPNNHRGVVFLGELLSDLPGRLIRLLATDLAGELLHLGMFRQDKSSGNRRFPPWLEYRQSIVKRRLRCHTALLLRLCYQVLLLLLLGRGKHRSLLAGEVQAK